MKDRIHICVADIRNEILAALPDMPVTERMEDVGRFIRENKPEGYFGDE